MDEEVPEIPERKFRFGCTTWLLIFLGLSLVVYVGFRLILRARVNAELDRIRAEGYPVTLAELDAWYEAPPGENAADLYAVAFVAYKDLSDEDDKLLPFVSGHPLPPPHEPLPDDVKAAMARYLAANEQAFKLLHEAAAVEACRWPVDLTQGINVAMPDLSFLRAGARRLALDAVYHAENGDSDKAIRSMASGLAMARSLRDEPILISQLVRNACLGLMVGDALKRLLSRGTFADAELAALSAALDEAHAPDAYGRAMVGERALFLFAMGEDISVHTFPGGSPSRLGRAVPNVLYTAVGLRDLDRIAWLQLTREVIEARKGDSTARTARIQQAEAQIPSYCILTRLVSGAYSRAMESDMRAVARIDAARVAVALERHRLANGKLPEALSELVPLYLDEVPTDPFDGKPLRYKKLENGYTVYSVGQDGADDGGETEGLRQPGGYYQEPPDTGLTIRRPKAEPSQSEDTDE